MKSFAYSFIGLMSILIINSCHRVKPKPPLATTLDSTLTIPLSTINIPIDYEVTKLEKMVNTKITGIFLRQWIKINDKGDSLYIELEKRADIKMSWNKQTLSYAFPLNVSSRIKKSVLGLKLKNNKLIRTELTLNLSTELGLDDQWNLQPHSKLKGIEWIKDPQLKILFIKINLQKIVETLIHKEEARLIGKLDEVFTRLIDTRKVASKIWVDLQKPIRINKQGVQVWLKADAQNISARLVDIDRKMITLDVELKAFVRTILEGDTIPIANKKLPPFKQKRSNNKSVNIFVLVRIPFVTANKFLDSALYNKELKAENYATKIKKTEVYGTDKGLALTVNVKGDINGRLYINAIPQYDSIHKKLYIKDFNFDIDSENALVNSADWLLHNNALDIIHDELTFDLKPYLNILPELIMQAVGKGKVGEKIDLAIDELNVKPTTQLITSSDFQIIFQASGFASIGLKQKVFAGKKKKVSHQ